MRDCVEGEGGSVLFFLGVRREGEGGVRCEGCMREGGVTDCADRSVGLS